MEIIEKDDEAANELTKRIWAAQESLKTAMEILDGAEARLICAGQRSSFKILKALR